MFLQAQYESCDTVHHRKDPYALQNGFLEVDRER